MHNDNNNKKSMQHQKQEAPRGTRAIAPVRQARCRRERPSRAASDCACRAPRSTRRATATRRPSPDVRTPARDAAPSVRRPLRSLPPRRSAPQRTRARRVTGNQRTAPTNAVVVRCNEQIDHCRRRTVRTSVMQRRHLHGRRNFYRNATSQRATSKQPPAAATEHRRRRRAVGAQCRSDWRESRVEAATDAPRRPADAPVRAATTRAPTSAVDAANTNNRNRSFVAKRTTLVLRARFVSCYLNGAA